MKLKNFIFKTAVMIASILFFSTAATENLLAQGASINTSGSGADPSALLDLSSNTQGFLVPRMTTLERDAINLPASSLLIYNTTTKCFEFFEYGVWQSMFCATILQFMCGTSNVSFTYSGSSVSYGTVSGANGTCWLDRNLGASQVAVAANDNLSYGDLFQWGRADDGHQKRNSTTTTTLSSNDIPGHSNFIRNSSSSPYDWRNPQNNTLWQGVNGTNNPCPAGWRLPTESELADELSTFATLNSAGAFATPLKWSNGGYRSYDASLNAVNTDGGYWASSITGTMVRSLNYGVNYAHMHQHPRAYGWSVRCVLD